MRDTYSTKSESAGCNSVCPELDILVRLCPVRCVRVIVRAPRGETTIWSEISIVVWGEAGERGLRHDLLTASQRLDFVGSLIVSAARATSTCVCRTQ